MTDTTPQLLLTREPVLDKNQLLAGYELYFTDPSVMVGQRSSIEAISKAFADPSLGQALSDCHAFISVDATDLTDTLANELIDELPAQLVVLQVSAQHIDEPLLLARCQTLKEKGYALCIADCRRHQPLSTQALELARWLKFDLRHVPPDDLQQLTSDLRSARRTLIATGVETPTQMELCALLGVELFQGYYFAQPDVRDGPENHTLDPSIQAIFRLIGKLSADADIDELETVLRTEPALVVSLLQLTNSVGVGARLRITSIRHALTVLGRRQLMRWLQLLLFRSKGRGDLAENPLMQYAALRGRFMELLTGRVHPGNTRLLDPAFITGLLSVLPAALNLPMRTILAQLPVDDAVKLALLHQEGDLGALLALLDAYDANDPAAVVARLTPFPDMRVNELGAILVDALNWVHTLKAEKQG